MERVIGWVLVKDCCAGYQSIGDKLEAVRSTLEDRLLLYTPGETLVLTRQTVGDPVFTRIHNLLVHLFEVDLSEDSYIKIKLSEAVNQ